MKTIGINKIGALGVLLAGATLMTSCDKKEREQLKAQAEALEIQLQERDSAFNSIMTVMAEVEGEIEKIKVQENLLATNGNADFSEDKEGKLFHDLKRINDQINLTNEKVKSLSAKLDDSSMELRAFKQRMNGLKKSLEERELSIAKLQEDLEIKDAQIAELNTEVESLVTTVQLQTETIEVQTADLNEKEKNLNTAYFAVDKEEKLVEEGLVTKEGGFLWIGKTVELQADAAQSKFTEVDIQNTKRFYIDSKKMQLVTEHPSDSYKIVSEDEKHKYLEVTNPEKFWKISKYLVISIKG